MLTMTLLILKLLYRMILYLLAWFCFFYNFFSLSSHFEKFKVCKKRLCLNLSLSTLQITAQYTPTVLHTITNPDGTVSIVQVDPNNPIITLPDGTTAHVQGMATVSANLHDSINFFWWCTFGICFMVILKF